MLRWQRVGNTSHAVDGYHQPVAGEQIRTLCDARLTVDDRDVQPYGHQPLMPACGDCRDVWADMHDDEEREQR